MHYLQVISYCVWTRVRVGVLNALVSKNDTYDIYMNIIRGKEMMKR